MTNPTNPELAREIVSRYPFLREFFRESVLFDPSTTLRIRRMTPAQLGEQITDEIGSSASGYSRTHTVKLLNHDGAKIATVRTGEHDWGTGQWTSGETIADAIVRSQPTVPTYVLWKDDESGSAVNDSPPSLTITLYKPPSEGWDPLIQERRSHAAQAVDQMEG